MSNFMWILLLLSILIISHLQFSCSQKSCIPRERTALLQFKNSLVDESNRLSSWTEGEEEDCCIWEGIGCNKKTGHVVKLDLSSSRSRNNGNSIIQGEISSSLLALENLNYLDLSMNNFSSTIQIPAFLGSLTNLRYLNLSSSGFNGNVPRELGNLSRLEHLDLSLKYDVAFSLVINSLSWITSLSSLRTLDLTLVYLNGCQDCFQSINMILPSLMSLRLRMCHLGFLPNLISNSSSSSLKFIDLSWNFINSSTIPLWFFNLTSLEHLDLSYNSFHGVIPSEASWLISLTSLELAGNKLMSPIPSSLSSSLRYLYLDDNEFGGLLPVRDLCNSTSLRVLNLSKNRFHGSISREIGCFRQLSELSLSSNEFSGTVPSNLGLLKNLEFLYLSSTSLAGEISEVHFSRMKKLKHLNLSSNSITLNMKPSWIPPFQIEEIHMDSVIVGPSFPPWLQTQKSLKILTMSNASISDKIPDWFEIIHSRLHRLDLSFNNISGKVPSFSEMNISYRIIRLRSNKFESMPFPFSYNLTVLNLAGNHISGPIPPPSLIPVQEDQTFISDSLIFLHLNDNCFNGSIPDSICQFKSLKLLDLSNNQLSGKLPFCLGNLRDLLVFKVANNSLNGQIPSSLGNIAFLQSLRLNKNKFNGELPLSMQFLMYMQFLDLGENEFHGIIPSWIGKNLSKLRILRLQSNHFHGNVSVHLCQLSKLQVLNLARNKLIGSIPVCFNNFTAMVSHLSNTGPFFYGIDGSMESFYRGEEKLINFVGGRELEYHSDNILLHFRSLDLSQNKITGEIPHQLMDLIGLKNLNLSRNSLTGNIPPRIGNLKELLSLDLSINQLSGSIPPSLANLNFLSYLNLSSNKLSGRIPMGNQLQTLDDPSIYAGNNGLCGKPVSDNCSDKNSSEENEDELLEEMNLSFSWFCAGLGPGFTVGILGVFSIFVCNKSWRNAYFFR